MLIVHLLSICSSENGQFLGGSEDSCQDNVKELAYPSFSLVGLVCKAPASWLGVFSFCIPQKNSMSALEPGEQ